ncbi:hypothetical protein D9757_000206 [Collybiopsis confluens]|uniref:DUF2423 domain-containing protein n=1 Tax=Collybiopsis confluens TaxID=2823264 RepID=A0A8H5MHE5_9AGAR|nr:hypothetical protein D9757_000206 [Collybiopsis confluens]
MAKSLRSKVKREFRSKKREAGVYAAAEAGRLHRLNAKLLTVASKDNGGDEVLNDEPTETIDTSGSLWLTAFSLMDPDNITADSMSWLAHAMHADASCSQTNHPRNLDLDLSSVHVWNDH